jgi:S-DNA-T family DNA segregation ATPase FtsK/SpoIIIE
MEGYPMPYSFYELPSSELLDSHWEIGPTVDSAALERNSRLLETVFKDFDISGEVVGVEPGPVVTRYLFDPARGIKMSKIVNLADDIARNMSAMSCRIATVPGHSYLGIELPNQIRKSIHYSQLLDNQLIDCDADIPLLLGEDISGQPVIVDLAAMPHLLLAGTTGSGKSVSLHSMIVSLLYRFTPRECRIMMIDPKMLELSLYEGIPHLMSPVITDCDKAITALEDIVEVMEDRYHKMAAKGVRNINGYNRLVGLPSLLPHIVVVIDEFADLMCVAGKKVEALVQRLAQKARAAGIHVIMATQRPSVDVVTGVLKANLPSRISFRMASSIDSRTIIGEGGAESLLGNGDMLYMNGSQIARLHGPFISDNEIERIVDHCKSQIC